MDDSGPYGQAWETYRRAGWLGVLPLPPRRKKTPPDGYTGWAGIDPSRADIQTWLDDPRLGPAANIALHLPDGVYGLDVDNYGAKTGGAALAALVERLGPLPTTWVVSSRDDGVSGIRLYRATLPPGRVWIDEPGGHQAGIESIHRGHRYAVVWPSIHPGTGRVYTWRQEGQEYGIVPDPTALPELPDAWIEALSRPGEVRQGTQAGHDETVATVTGWREDELCERVRRAAEGALGGLSAATAGATLHPVANSDLFSLACLGHEGHAGVRGVLARHHAAFVLAAQQPAHGRLEREADGEWWRMVRGAVGKLAGPRVERCDCDLWSGAGVTFTPEDLGVVYGPTPPASALAMTMLDAARARLLTPSQVRAMRRPPSLVRGVLRMDTLAWVIASPGSFKSFVALDLAARVAAGLDWAGRPVRTPGAVLYVAAEGASGMSTRIEAWEKTNGPMSEAVQVMPVAVQAGNPDAWGVLIALVADLRPVLVIVDTQARVATGIKENDNTAMGELITRFDELRRAAGSCVLVVHHTGRVGAHARGGSAIDGAQDTELRIERTGGPKALSAEITIDKQKDGPDTDRIKVEVSMVDLGLDEYGDPVTSLVATCLPADPFAPDIEYVELPEDQGRILAILRDQFNELGANKAELMAAWIAKTPTGGAKIGSVKRRFNRALDKLAATDKLAKIHGTQRFIPADRVQEIEDHHLSMDMSMDNIGERRVQR